MARNEQVIYECDVCGRKAQAQKVTHEGNTYFVRPDGWGHIYASAQKNSTRVQKKSDFCSEKCLVEVWDDWYAAAYD
jgi:hypothetical protein